MTMADQVIPQKPIISKHEFYFETPLYEWVEEEVLESNFTKGDVDAYSAKNGIDTTYSISSERLSDYPNDPFYNFFGITLTCKRKDNDVLCYVVYRVKSGDETLYGKFGQLPSLADIQFAEIGKKYDKYLSRTDLSEFKKAIGLAAHGVGAGSFVYLRRIFEKLIADTYKKHSAKIGIEEKEFNAKHMEEKVELLKAYLPSQLVEMKSVYSILSKGVHELTEQECLKYFSALKLSIELILEQQIENESKKQRDKAVKQQLQEIGHELQKPKSK